MVRFYSGERGINKKQNTSFILYSLKSVDHDMGLFSDE